MEYDDAPAPPWKPKPIARTTASPPARCHDGPADAMPVVKNRPAPLCAMTALPLPGSVPIAIVVCITSEPAAPLDFCVHVWPSSVDRHTPNARVPARKLCPDPSDRSSATDSMSYIAPLV